MNNAVPRPLYSQISQLHKFTGTLFSDEDHFGVLSSDEDQQVGCTFLCPPPFCVALQSYFLFKKFPYSVWYLRSKQKKTITTQ